MRVNESYIDREAVPNVWSVGIHTQHTHTTVSRPFFRYHPGEPVPGENFCTLWYKGRLTEAGSPTVRSKWKEMVSMRNRILECSRCLPQLWSVTYGY